jgi:acetyl esterase/lipase
MLHSAIGVLPEETESEAVSSEEDDTLGMSIDDSEGVSSAPSSARTAAAAPVSASAASLSIRSSNGGLRDATPLPPALLYIHGGGFVGSSFASDQVLLGEWAAAGPLLLVYCHYTLSPEARFPAALHEIVRVYAWLRRRSQRVVLFGESAGGNLAAATVLLVRPTHNDVIRRHYTPT